MWRQHIHNLDNLLECNKAHVSLPKLMILKNRGPALTSNLASGNIKTVDSLRNQDPTKLEFVN